MSGKQYVYDDTGNLVKIQMVENGKIVRDSSVFVRYSGNDDRVMELRGVYQGKDIYLKNPKIENLEEHCIKRILVNGENYIDSLDKSIVGIRMSSFFPKAGDTIRIKIIHHNSCLPLVLQETDCFGSSLNLISFQIDNYGTLYWTTETEKINGNFWIEEFRWNKWIKIAEMENIAGKTKNEYSFQPVPHSGECIFRIRQPNSFFTSNTVKKDLKIPEVKFDWSKRSKEVKFSAETIYEVFDSMGNLVKKGFSAKIDCGNLPRGEYYVNYDNATEKFKI